MASGIGSKIGYKEPLYFFYDIEATGINPNEDRIIEIASTIHTSKLQSRTRQELERNKSHEFSSLCYCEKELSTIAEELTGLTRRDLIGQPQLKVVLKDLFDWIKASISKASEIDRKKYVPVLVAHSGPKLDFPLLFLEVDSSLSLACQFKNLDLHYVDTFSVLKDLKRNKLSYRQLESLSLKNIYKTYFGVAYEGHRALADAKALCKIFSDAAPASDIHMFIKHMYTRYEVEQIEKFRGASIYTSKTIELLQKGITYERLVTEYQRSPVRFVSFLRESCGITRPRRELIDHFKDNQW